MYFKNLGRYALIIGFLMGTLQGSVTGNEIGELLFKAGRRLFSVAQLQTSAEHLSFRGSQRLYSSIVRPHTYAIATTDTAFKHMLSISTGADKNIVISFLNSFIPHFRGDPITDVQELSPVTPALKKPIAKAKQTFMDLHVTSSKNVHYLIEMQAQRHVMFDERALFYACSTYSRQLSEKDLGTEDWYKKLKPVIALQILDYDTNRVRGIKGDVPDTLVQRVKKNPLPSGKFIKHYLITDNISGQTIDYLQMVQVELPRAEEIKSLFPPTKTFQTLDWWLSVLKHSNEYTDDVMETFKKDMPEDIYKALKRLDLTTWNPREAKEYQEDISRRDLYESVLAVERSEGEESATERIALNMIKAHKTDKEIAELTGWSKEKVELLRNSVTKKVTAQ